MEAFEPPRDHGIRFIHDEELLCGNGLVTLPNKAELWVQFVPKSAPLTPVSARKSRKSAYDNTYQHITNTDIISPPS